MPVDTPDKISALEDAIKIVKEYAGSGNPAPGNFPEIIERVYNKILEIKEKGNF